MPVLFGILGAIGVVIIDYLLSLLLGLSFSNFTALFIIPIGGILEGGLCGLTLFLALKKLELKSTARHYLLAGLIAFASFWAISYVQYATAYVDNNGEINHLFEGKHISNFSFTDNEPITYSKYLNYSLENTEMKMSYKGRNLINAPTINLGKGYNTFNFGIIAIGFIIGGMLVGLLVFDDTAYCDYCKKYKNTIHLFDFTVSDCHKKINQLKYAIHYKRLLKEFIATKCTNAEDVENREPYISVYLQYCESCKDGVLLLKRMEARFKDGKVIRQENTKARSYIRVGSETVPNLL